MLIAIMIASVVLATGLVITSIFIVELKTSGLATESTKALYAAESSVEWKLYELRKEAAASPVMGNNTTGEILFVSTTSGTIIRAVGTSFRGNTPTAKRSLQIQY